MARRAPLWLRRMVPEVMACLESTAPIAPLGYSWRKDKQGWLLCVYPRANEWIGGQFDGKREVPGFRLCLSCVMRAFDAPPHIEWEAPSEFTGHFDGPCVMLDGFFEGRPLELLVFDRPPPAAKVGMLVDWQRGEVRRCKRPG